jgi:tRNA threonylcarbamoyladenosine biosynthesis protein TsaE
MTQPTANFDIITYEPEQTRVLGLQFGEALKSGMVLSLEGDLGAGKTLFVKGLAEGLSVPESIYVTSPSYAIIHEYPGRLPLFHADLYRIEDSADLDDLGLFEIMDGDKVVAIEWAERIRNALPPEGMTIRFEMLNDEVRKISMAAAGLQAVDVLRTLR